MRVCSGDNCPTLIKAGTRGNRCPPCQGQHEKQRGTASQRGYGSMHKKLRADLAPNAIGKACHFCGLPMLEGQPLALDHTEDRLGYRGMAHLSCNAVDGGRRSHN